jgi:phosphate starvation-inducible protein PhoH
MGAKRKVAVKSRQHTNTNYDNVINLKPMGKPVQKKTTVTILPRNRNQETYVLNLLDPEKDIVFGVGPAGTGKTMLAVQVAVKLFKEGQVDKQYRLTKTLAFYQVHWRKKWHRGLDQYSMY